MSNCFSDLIKYLVAFFRDFMHMKYLHQDWLPFKLSRRKCVVIIFVCYNFLQLYQTESCRFFINEAIFLSVLEISLLSYSLHILISISALFFFYPSSRDKFIFHQHNVILVQQLDDILRSQQFDNWYIIFRVVIFKRFRIIKYLYARQRMKW